MIHIGTSGWSYNDWVGIFYPEHTKSIDFLKFYGEKFNTVEVNSSFYNTLKEKTVLNWTQEVPADFIFAIKADRYITHIKKLEDPEQTVPDFLQSIKQFKEKLGPVLFQLPPSLGFNSDKLKAFVKVLPKDFLYVLEFRNKDWFIDETYKILEENNIALCIYNLKGFQSPVKTTADFTYIRYHGTKGIGVGKYSDDDIKNLAVNINNFVSEKKDVFCYFNNGSNGAAIENAQELISLIKQ